MELEHKIQKKIAKVGIIGLGYVGLPLLLRFAEQGYAVIGIDTDPEKSRKLSECQSYLKHIKSSEISEKLAKSPSSRFYSDSSAAADADVLIICVPTPLTKHREPDLSYIVESAKALLPHLRPGQLISLESTTYPGTTEEILAPLIESSGLKIGTDLFLCFSPEREDPGNEKFSTHNIPKVVSGVTPRCLKLAELLYSSIVNKIVVVSAPRVAEMTKLLENIHRAVNIGLVNEMKVVADRMGIDIFEVIRAAATKPFGFVPYYPGPGLGGHCIPIDPFYLTWKAREYGVHTRFIELAGEVNCAMPDYVVSKVAHALNKNMKSIKGASILILGVAYKKNIEDIRESPALQIMKILQDQGAKISYSDPHVPDLRPCHDHNFSMKGVPLTTVTIDSADAVVLLTDHNDFDYKLIAEKSKLIIDTRGKFEANQNGLKEKLVKA